MNRIQKKYFFLNKLTNDQGSLLVIVYFVIVVLLGLGGALMLLASNEARMAERQRLEAVAFYIAEAGLERAFYDLRQDFVASAWPSWSDGDINGYSLPYDIDDFMVIPYVDTTFNAGHYTVSLKNVAGSSNQIWVQSTGTIQDASVTIQAYLRINNNSIWNNAIFAGGGASGSLINGNVNISGSVTVLGDGLNPGDYAMHLGGDAQLVGNNYKDLPAALAAKVPALPTTVFNGEVVSTLNGVLRVKKGIVGLSGSAEVGQSNVAGNAVKETVDGTFVTDGWGGNKGAVNVHSDNGTTQPYDLGDDLRFPLLSDPEPLDPTRTVQQYFRDNALVLTNELINVQAGSNFNYSNAHGSISLDGSGNLTISGRVYIDGNNNLNIAGSGTINYTGKGTILVTGNIGISANLQTPGNNSFPTNVIGLMTPNDISFTTAQLIAMGLFYAEGSVIATKQTNVLGSFVSNYFDMGNQVPKIFQVPEAMNSLPPGLIGGGDGWQLQIVSWQMI